MTTVSNYNFFFCFAWTSQHLIYFLFCFFHGLMSANITFIFVFSWTSVSNCIIFRTKVRNLFYFFFHEQMSALIFFLFHNDQHLYFCCFMMISTYKFFLFLFHNDQHL